LKRILEDFGEKLNDEIIHCDNKSIVVMS